MSKLRLADDLQLPIDACTQTFAWIGRKGSGKTYGAGKLAEELLKAEIQTVILDTVGNWYGLRIAADGKGKGFDVPVFGGLRQDLPLLATAGEVVADVVMDSRRSVILDVSQFNFSERKRFAADFGTRLWQRKKGEADPSPLHLIIEECQLIVPQFVQKDDTRMVHVYEEIIRLGRNYGIGVSMLTQRPQSVNKEVLTQAECIMAFQINGVPERKALKEWLTYEGGDVNLVNELPGLSIGTCYLWSPQWLRTFKKVTIGKKSTLDASATPKAGQKLIRRDPAPLDVHDIEARMLSTIEKAKADDPRHLRAKIGNLERELNLAKSITPAKSEPTVKELPVLRDGQLKRIESVTGQAQMIVNQFSSLANELREALSKVANNIPIKRTNVMPRHAGAVPRGHGTRVTTHSVGDPGSTAHIIVPQQRILDALAWLESVGVKHARRSQVAFLAGASPTSSAFVNNLGALRTRALIAYPSHGNVGLTDTGHMLAAPMDRPLSPAELHDMIFQKLPTPQSSILKVLIGIYPKDLPREEVAQRAGASPTSSAFVNNLGALRSLGFIDYPSRGSVAAQPVLFLE